MAPTKITRRDDDNHGNHDEFFERLLTTLDNSMKTHSDRWVREQEQISEKFDLLQNAYVELVGRLTTVEAKDFGSAVAKIDDSLKKMISLGLKVDTIEYENRQQEKIIEELKDKCHRANLIINIALGCIVSVVIPLLIAVIPYMIDFFKNKGQ